MKPREAAYLAILASLKEETFVIHTLSKWQEKDSPSSQDFAFALEIAAGSVRMALTLDAIAVQLSTSGKLNVKSKEKALLREAIYQHYFMDKVPLYAIVNESVELAKKYCHSSFTAYLNALLRKMESATIQIPTGNSPEDLSIRYSYPVYFVKQLIIDYGHHTTEEILKQGNKPPETMARVRPGVDITPHSLSLLTPYAMLLTKEQVKGEENTFFTHRDTIPSMIAAQASALATISQWPTVYIQNITPVTLVSELVSRTSTPHTILDLCASPGGKLIAAHDAYPQAELFANDVSQEKIDRLKENLTKYGIKAHISCGLGEEYSNHKKFDLIILDLPCSNSGVLNKRAEARWRMTPEDLNKLHQQQEILFRHAKTLLSEQGVIWYLTCSILKSENERLVERMAKECAMDLLFSETILPQKGGWDGGFAALVKG